MSIKDGKKFKVYLAGSVKESGYRKYSLKNYSDDFNLYDPLIEVEEGIMGYNPGEIVQRKVDITDKMVSTIVEEDKKAILTCDVVVAYMDVYSCGTVMEILYAHTNNIPVYIINPNSQLLDDIWLKYHSEKFFGNIDAFFNFLKDEQEKHSKYEPIDFHLNISKVQSLLNEQDKKTRHACAEAITTHSISHVITKDLAHHLCMNVSSRINAGQIPIGWYME